MQLAYTTASWSKDPSKQVGCLLVKDKRIVGQGYNGLPSLMADTACILHDKQTKLLHIVHAELNAILNAAAIGASTNGCTCYVTWPPCTHCASAIMQAGIVRVVIPAVDLGNSSWQKSASIARAALKSAGIAYTILQ